MLSLTSCVGAGGMQAYMLSLKAFVTIWTLNAGMTKQFLAALLTHFTTDMTATRA